jgi:hypothetical protein
MSLISPEKRAWLQQRLEEENQRTLKLLRAIAQPYPSGYEPLRSEVVERLSRGISFSAAWQVREVLKRLESQGSISWRRGRTRGRDRLLLPRAEQ